MDFNQKKYINKYNKETYKMFPFRVKKSDTSVINKLKAVESMNSYILSLIYNDLNPNVLTIKKIKEQILPILRKYGINEVYLYGSYSRGEATYKSDVDIYCEAGNVKTLIEQGILEDELKTALQKDVDLIFIGTKMDAFFQEQLDKDKIRLC